jgi:hypothetical protein
MEGKNKVGLTELTARIKYYDPKTVRRRLYAVIELLGLNIKEFKNEKGVLEFDENLVELIIFLVNHIDDNALKNLRLEKNLSLDDIRDFNAELLKLTDRLDEPFRSEVMQLSEKFLLERCENLSINLMARVNKAKEILDELPTIKRIEVLENLYEPLDKWIISLQGIIDKK